MKIKVIRIGIITVLISFLLISIWAVATPCPATLRPWGAPGYVESVWPPATSKTLLSCFTTSGLGYVPEREVEVGIGLNTDSIWELEVPQSATENVPSFPERVTLFVDTEQVPITNWAEGGGAYFVGDTELDLAGWYFFGSSQSLSSGDHMAKVVIATRSGKTLEFEWHFIKD